MATKKKEGSGETEVRGEVSARYDFHGDVSSPRGMLGELTVE